MTLNEMQARVTEVMGRSPTRVAKDENPLQPYGLRHLWYDTSTGVLEHVIVLIEVGGVVKAGYAMDGSFTLCREISKLNWVDLPKTTANPAGTS